MLLSHMNFIAAPIVQVLCATVVNNELTHEFLEIPNLEQKRSKKMGTW